MTRLSGGFLAMVAAAMLAACGSSTSTATSPATVPRCGVTIPTTDLNVPATGGSGRLAINTARECTWTTTTTAGWLSIKGEASGQGDGSVEYVAAPNPDPTTRKASIEVNNQRADVTQAAGQCVMQLRDSSASFSNAGGSGTIGVQASSSQCAWTAQSDSSWLVIRSGASGTGSGTVAFDVSAASGPPRTGTILVAGLRFAVTQSEGCTYSVDPTSYSAGSSGGTGTIAVATGAGCPWTAVSNVDWASIPGGSERTGPGTVQIVVSPTSGSSRTGTALVAGQTIALTQSAGCSYDVSPLAHAFDAQGGTGSSTVSAGPGCAWSATSDGSWITLTGPTSGAGNGTISFAIAASSGAPRTGTITVADRTIAISQAGGCSFSIAPTSASVPATGGTGTVTVTAGAGCAWTATSNAAWLTITSGASGSGNGTLAFSAASTTGGPRSGTLTIAGQTFTVEQGSGCSFSISPTSDTVAASGGTGTVNVTAAAGCAWTAATNVPWIAITSGASGTGNGSVKYSVTASTGGARSGTLTIAGQTFTVNQGSGCSFSIAPTSASMPASGGLTSVAVTTTAGCAWTSSSAVNWITVKSGASGSGNGTVQLDVAANTGTSARTGTVTIAGQTFTVNQAAPCTYSISPTSRNAPGDGGADSFNLTTGPACGWTAVSDVSWITVLDVSGTGSAKIDYLVLPNTTNKSRNGTISVGGQTFTVTQGK